jgi:hypothetical protein
LVVFCLYAYLTIISLFKGDGTTDGDEDLFRYFSPVSKMEVPKDKTRNEKHEAAFGNILLPG